jgi:hypothetical protein
METSGSLFSRLCADLELHQGRVRMQCQPAFVRLARMRHWAEDLAATGIWNRIDALIRQAEVQAGVPADVSQRRAKR